MFEISTRLCQDAKAMRLSPLPSFLVDEKTNMAQRWTEWKEAFQYFVTGSDITDDKQKKAMLLHQAGMEVQRIFRSSQCQVIHLQMRCRR